MHKIINGFWTEGKIGNGWEKARIFTIFKGEDEENRGNYRGISLLDVGYKILSSIKEERLGSWLEKKKILKESQAGFRRKRSTRDHIFVLNSLKK